MLGQLYMSYHRCFFSLALTTTGLKLYAGQRVLTLGHLSSVLTLGHLSRVLTLGHLSSVQLFDRLACLGII